jgi:hypothetical protein
MATYPQDQFDVLPDDLLRVGAHRGPKVKGRGWIGFAWAALATGVLIVAGIYTLSRLDANFAFELPSLSAEETSTPTATASAEPEVVPITDPGSIDDRDITITVLNGTATTGLENDAADVLNDADWNVTSEASASANDVETTVVYYSDAANEDVAAGIVLALGTGETRLSDAFVGAPITVVLGADFPAAE